MTEAAARRTANVLLTAAALAAGYGVLTNPPLRRLARLLTRAWLRALSRRTRDIVQLTGQSFWRGFLGFYNSDNLTYAASIAYYALLSLFPFALLAFAVLGRAAADPNDRRA